MFVLFVCVCICPEGLHVKWHWFFFFFWKDCQIFKGNWDIVSWIFCVFIDLMIKMMHLFVCTFLPLIFICEVSSIQHPLLGVHVLCKCTVLRCVHVLYTFKNFKNGQWHTKPVLWFIYIYIYGGVICVVIYMVAECVMIVSTFCLLFTFNFKAKKM